MTPAGEVLYPNEPLYLGLRDGSHWYEAAQTQGRNPATGEKHVTRHVIRDWRQDFGSNLEIERITTDDYIEKRRLNVLENHAIHKTLRALKDTYAGRTAYVILSGPSVIEDLRKNPPKSGDVVFAVNQGFVYAANMNVPVDHFVIGDGVIDMDMLLQWDTMAKEYLYGNSVRHLLDTGALRRAVEGASLIACQWMKPDLRRAFGDRVYYFRPAGTGEEHRRTGINMALPEIEYCFNTGSMMLNLCDVMGFSQIVFVGADCAYTSLLRHPGEPESKRQNAGYIMRADKHGKIIVTDIHLLLSCLKTEAWAWLLGTKYGVRCVNLTAGGIMGRHFETARREDEARPSDEQSQGEEDSETRRSPGPRAHEEAEGLHAGDGGGQGVQNVG